MKVPNCKNIKKYSKSSITIEGITYPTKKAACEKYGMLVSTVNSYRFKHKVDYITAFLTVYRKKLKDQSIANKRRNYRIKDTPIDFFIYRFSGRNSFTTSSTKKGMVG